MVSNILLWKVCEELTRTQNINRDLMMPKRMVDTINPEIKKHHSARDICLILNNAKVCQTVYKDTVHFILLSLYRDLHIYNIEKKNICVYIYSSLCKSLMLSQNTLIMKNIKITVFLSLNRNNTGRKKIKCKLQLHSGLA